MSAELKLWAGVVNGFYLAAAVYCARSQDSLCWVDNALGSCRVLYILCRPSPNQMVMLVDWETIRHGLVRFTTSCTVTEHVCLKWVRCLLWGQLRCKENPASVCTAGDIFLAAACISYVGPFTGTYRDRLVQAWKGRCQELGVPVSDPFSLQATLATPMSIREWTLQASQSCHCPVGTWEPVVIQRVQQFYDACLGRTKCTHKRLSSEHVSILQQSG